MISVNDLVHLPYTPDLTEGGIAYALRSLPYTFDRAGSPPYERLRRIVAGVAVELAFRRYLGEQNIPFEVKGAAPFTDPDRYDVALGGHRCELKSFLISQRRQISGMRRDPGIVLQAPALVPSDLHAGEGHSDNDLYIFAFLAGLVAASREDLKKVLESGKPDYLVHVMPQEWRRPLNWNPLRPLALKSESEQELVIEINGQDEGREVATRVLHLPPKTKLLVEHSFYSITSLHVQRLPQGRLGIHCETHREPYLVPPLEWGNIWVYGMDIVLAGYISRGEFRRRAGLIAPNSRVFQYNHTHVKNLAVPVSDLYPLSDLFEKVREWDRPGT